MRDDTAIVHHNEGSAFGLTFLDLPGCFAAVDSWDEISAAAAEALDLWFEDMPSGQPASLSEIRARPEVARERKAGADLLPVPGIPAAPPRAARQHPDRARAVTSDRPDRKSERHEPFVIPRLSRPS